MAKQTINIGVAANDKKGDSLRAAFQKVNSNFTELYEIGFKGWTLKTSNYTALNGDRIIANTSSGPFTITLPTNPQQGYFVEIADGWNFAINNLTLVSARPIEGYNEDVVINIQGLSLEFVYVGNSWQILTTLGVKGDKGDPGEGFVLGSEYNISIVNDNSTLLVNASGGGTINLDGTIRDDVIPAADNAYDLGSPSRQFRSLYVSGNTIYLGGTPLSVDVSGNLLVDGAVVGGGAANTGDVTFSGIKVIGAGSASGDGNGYSTLELVPDNSLYGNNQYLVIDPTQPNHIHIRAGGTPDASSAELFLGGERNHVRINDGTGVRLANEVFTTAFYNFQQDTDYDTAVWLTDESGNHFVDITITNPATPTRSADPFNVSFYNFAQYPQNKIEIYDGNTYIDVFSAGQAYTMGNPYQLRMKVTQGPTTNPTSITSMTFLINTSTQSALLLEDNTFDLFVANNAYIYANQTIQLTTGVGNIQITADDNNSSQTWYFTAQGYLQFPQGLGPTTSRGKEGDEAGSVVVDGDYIYYCHTDYTDGLTDIWKRVAWSNDTW